MGPIGDWSGLQTGAQASSLAVAENLQPRRLRSSQLSYATPTVHGDHRIPFEGAGAIASWNKGAEFGPRWYPLALVVVSLPGVLLGGFLRGRQLRVRGKLF